MEKLKNFTKNETIVIDSGLDWIGRMFRPELHNLWKKDGEEYYASTLTSYRYNLEKFLPHLPAKKVTELKKAIDDFLLAQKKFKETKKFIFRFYRNFSMNKKSEIVFNKTSELMANNKQAKQSLVNY